MLANPFPHMKGTGLQSTLIHSILEQRSLIFLREDYIASYYTLAKVFLSDK